VIAAELAQNEKERAENLMIVDLVRNDLGAVCEAGSVRVARLLEVEEHSTVFQLVSEISGELQPGQDGLDALNSLFPAGSMTGAPKASAIQLLERLESLDRGPYAGAIGYFTSNGDIELGMTIRTAIFDGAAVSIGIGGGITIDSLPEAEHDEIVLKAAAHVDLLGAVARW
jgi:anthranilate/para-aminobenzoate synthase component I